MAQSASSSFSIEMETLNHVCGLVEAFRAFDSDNDGSINRQELGGIMGSLGYKMSEQDIEAMIQRGDKNRDGLLSISEFLEMNTGDLYLGELTPLKMAFEALDLEEHDLVSGEELYQVIENLGIDLSLEECCDIVASVDGDGDGAITFEDFKLIVNSLV